MAKFTQERNETRLVIHNLVNDGETFTIQDIMRITGFDRTPVNDEVVRALKNNLISNIGTVKNESGRGRPLALYGKAVKPVKVDKIPSLVKPSTLAKVEDALTDEYQTMFQLQVKVNMNIVTITQAIKELKAKNKIVVSRTEPEGRGRPFNTYKKA